MTVISCRAPYGEGGLGRHFAQVVAAARAEGGAIRYFSAAAPADDPDGHSVVIPWAYPLKRYTPLRFSPAGKTHVFGDLFDRAVARRLVAPVDAFIGFVGKTLHSFRRAQSLGARHFTLHVGNSHVRKTHRRHAQAIQRYGIGGSWLGRMQLEKSLREYALADTIVVNSEYTRQSFLDEGFPPEKLDRIQLVPDPRYRPPEARPQDGVFRIVYVGSLTVTKGIPVLLDAFARLPIEAAELRLVGGWTTRAMRKYIEAAQARDPRITVGPGDPLPHFHRADVCVHPSYEDGFAYAPAEALACGVPVVVSEDTGMKEHVREGENGFVVPTGDVDALVERLMALHAHPIIPV